MYSMKRIYCKICEYPFVLNTFGYCEKCMPEDIER